MLFKLLFLFYSERLRKTISVHFYHCNQLGQAPCLLPFIVAGLSRYSTKEIKLTIRLSLNLFF